MLLLRICLAVCLLLGSFAPVRAGLKVQAEEIIADGLVLVSAEFGLFEEAPDGGVVIKSADTIPFKEGQAYGWRLRFRTARESVKLKEELQLPSRPKSWDTPGDAAQNFKVSPDGRTGTTDLEAVLDGGVLMNAWKIAEGDPTGDHVLRLYVEGKLVRTFKFKIEAPEGKTDGKK
jgi:hypothetical protein